MKAGAIPVPRDKEFADTMATEDQFLSLIHI